MTSATSVVRISLEETGPGCVAALTSDQVAALLTVPGLVRLSPAPGGRWRLAGNQKVGLVRLRTPGCESLELCIRPKLAIRALLFLLTYSPHDPWLREAVDAAEAGELLPALAHLLARVARRTMEAGVLHGYRSVEEDLPLVRGRIRTGDQLRRTGLPLPIAVSYDDHTPDIAENRILLAGLLRAARLPGIPAHTTALLRHLADRLSGVHLLTPGAPLPAWSATRLNARYGSVLRLAELLLSNRSVQPEGTTTVTTDGFLLDMPAVFQRFLTSALGDALGGRGIRCAAEEQHHRLDEAGHVPMRPDVVLYRAGRIIGVVDAKYSVLDTSAPPTAHLYQLLGYCTALGLSHGHLVYATATPRGSTDHVIRRSGITVTAHVLPLDQTPGALISSVYDLADRIATPN